jgi:hypothetical protein
MITEKEAEKLIYETAAGAAEKFLTTDRGSDPFLPPGLIEEAVRRQVVYIGRIAFAFEEKLRELIPYAYDPEEFTPVLEGVVVGNDEREYAA